ncbi:hypothetical protein GJ496_011498 [Pomphorhynchus laevis]|nr:hypothetical protein GJ496_011498 [Pomphorhynchus laevis]
MKSPLMNDELDLIAQMIQSYSKYFAITLMLVWTRVFKFAHFSNVTSFIAIMFKQCWPDILSFSLVLFFSLSAFTVLGIQWFGHRLHSYVNYRYAMFTLFRILIGDVEPNHLYSIRPLMGAMYFFAYAAVVIFLLQSLFLAIINDAYQSIQAISYLDLEPEYEMTFLDETEKLRRHLRDQVMVKEEISKLQQMLSNELEKEDSDAVGLRLNELLHNQGFTMENIHEFYEKYDVNKDAKIDKSEFQQVLSQITATLENCEQEIKELEEKLINLTKQQRKLKKGSNINLASTTRASDKYANDEVISYEEYLILEEELKELQNEVIDVYKNIESKLNPDRRPVNYQPYKLSS